jgi:hypothetical protein
MNRGLITSLLVCSTMVAVHAQNANQFNYLDPQRIEIEKFLDPPPGCESPQAIGELAEIRAWERLRKSNDVERIRQAINMETCFLLFIGVLGVELDAVQLCNRDAAKSKASQNVGTSTTPSAGSKYSSCS